jgi:hypothetical protein
MECKKLSSVQKSNGNAAEANNASTGQLRNITDEFIDSKELDAFVSDDDDNSITNYTIEDALIYFACLSNHYL